jgi:hypothetical protein
MGFAALNPSYARLHPVQPPDMPFAAPRDPETARIKSPQRPAWAICSSSALSLRSQLDRANPDSAETDGPTGHRLPSPGRTGHEPPAIHRETAAPQDRAAWSYETSVAQDPSISLLYDVLPTFECGHGADRGHTRWCHVMFSDA